jgi:hypothetical protein
MFMDRKRVEWYKAQYPQGTKIELERMNDPYRDMPRGVKGIVDIVDDAGQIHCIWENGSRLALIPGEDTFHVVKEPEAK